MELNNYFRLSFRGITENESFVRSTVAAFCTQLNPTIEEVNDIKTAVSEAVTNCIVHGYSGKIGEIVIDVSLFDDNVEIKISDTGCGFVDIQKAMQPFYTTKPEQERSGMGFTLMQAFMDSVEVISTVNIGTTVIMRKNISREYEDVRA
ncbi:MAG: anti-sigma F factor [Clostridia bacterium]|nr:anti-sigma F factor [Clostridia bacterium]